MKVIPKICLCLIVVLLLAFGLFVISNYVTNGFESLSFLYLKTNGAKINNSLEIKQSGQVEIQLKTAGFSKKIEEYTVKIIPNADYDFEYSADGSNYRFSTIDDLSEQFNVRMQANVFTFDCKSMKELLSDYHNGAEILFLNDMAQKTDYFTLVVARDNGKYQSSVNMCYYSPVEDVKLTPGGIIL